MTMLFVLGVLLVVAAIMHARARRPGAPSR